MNKYKFLKQIYDKGKVKPIDTNLYSKDNTEVQTVLKLNDQGLVNYHVGLHSNAQDYYMAEYWITDKGKEYVDKNSSKQKISDIAIGALFGALFSLLVWLIENYLFKK
ncbi:hypothetical protein [Lactobacillus gasseri]|uniref:hypothetical protein n=1 Tax=Lactobacillus gasseri TaxID=1596 RepID=UPI0029C1C033|nr:hypothetical protein [Lactobacillus gasseri]MDX5065819.1 hypothetical protein [Lactobacillus gasseri]MDX5082520.1 hypothetical protein [Lactobacillus gasseri]